MKRMEPRWAVADLGHGLQISEATLPVFPAVELLSRLLLISGAKD